MPTENHLKMLETAMHEFVQSKGWYEADSPRPQTLRNLAVSLVLEASEVLEHFQWGEQLRDREEFAAVAGGPAQTLGNHGARPLLRMHCATRRPLRQAGGRSMMPKSCGLFGKHHAVKQRVKAKCPIRGAGSSLWSISAFPRIAKTLQLFALTQFLTQNRCALLLELL